MRFNRGRNQFSDKEIGDFTIICGGKAVCPGSWAGSVLSWLLILGPSAVQIVAINSAYPMASILDVFYIISISVPLTYLLLTTITDPGVIPRGKKDQLLTPEQLGIKKTTSSEV